MTLAGYKIVYKYKGKIRYSIATYSTKEEAEKEGKKDKDYSTIQPYYVRN